MTIVHLFFSYVKIACFSFGGIFSTWSLLETTLKGCEVETDGCLLSRTGFAFALSISNLLPGPKVSGLSVVSYETAGVIGMLVTVAGLVTPGLVIIPLIRFVRTRWSNSSALDAFVHGARFATLAILIMFCFALAQSSIREGGVVTFAGICAVVFWLSFRYRINAILLIPLSGLAGHVLLG